MRFGPDGYPLEILPTINEMNRLFERISLSQQEQKQFIADAAHELRTPDYSTEFANENFAA